MPLNGMPTAICQGRIASGRRAGFYGHVHAGARRRTGHAETDASLGIEELAKGCATTAAFLTIHNVATNTVGRYCQPDVIDQWCPDLVSGTKLASYCLTEPDAGPTQQRCEPAAPMAIITSSTAARRLSRAQEKPTSWF